MDDNILGELETLMNKKGRSPMETSHGMTRLNLKQSYSGITMKFLKTTLGAT